MNRENFLHDFQKNYCKTLAELI